MKKSFKDLKGLNLNKCNNWLQLLKLLPEINKSFIVLGNLDQTRDLIPYNAKDTTVYYIKKKKKKQRMTKSEHLKNQISLGC